MCLQIIVIKSINRYIVGAKLCGDDKISVTWLIYEKIKKK